MKRDLAKTRGGQIGALSLERQRRRHKKSYDRQHGGWVEEAIVCSGGRAWGGGTFQRYVGAFGSTIRELRWQADAGRRSLD